MIDQNSLAKIVGSGKVSQDTATLEAYSSDISFVNSIRPRYVVKPSNKTAIRELVKLALEYNAAAMVVAHNHPSGKIQPSPQDRQLTRTLYLACSFMNIRLLDHLIIGQSEKIYSFADQGIMASIGEECSRMLSQ